MSLSGKTIGHILRKISFSIKILFLLIAGFSLIGVPLSIYDKHVIEADQKCYESGSNPTDIINNVLGTDHEKELISKHIQLRKKCHITVSRHGNAINLDSTRVIIDNRPEPKLFFWTSLFIAMVALLIHLLEKWIMRLLKDE